MNEPPTDETQLPALIDRERLIRRWQHGSDSFFWRHEASGALRALSDGIKVRYRLSDIFAFEGGQPPDDLIGEYASDLLTEVQAARLCAVRPSYILAAARSGDLPVRRIGRAFRFVPAELEAWRARRFVNRETLKKRGKAGDE
ncbi:DNA-binding protein [Roseovarius spongiae]|uniref:DNA-binding protein n=1 Tax=Roseovarius spongiae TaxID=2320272 RepID=A0A3A8B1J5_9RHOB|nr:helix-turn-helix domain-containing protein [Roseovarius spongiae]RKF12400.1 DNA-binding protein [Roseovarius spongiae]